MREEQTLLPLRDPDDGVVSLTLREITSADPVTGYVPAYHFTIARVGTGEPVGLLSLRVGTSEWLSLYADTSATQSRSNTGVAAMPPGRCPWWRPLRGAS